MTIEEMKKRARNYLELFTVIASGFVLLTTEVYHLYADKTFWGGTNLIPILAIGYYMVFLYSFPVNYEFFYKKNKFVAITTVLTAVCNIILNYFFIKCMGSMGAAIATAIAHAFQFLFHYICARFVIKEGEFPFSMRMQKPYTAVFLDFALLPILLPDAWLLRWGLGAALGVW